MSYVKRPDIPNEFRWIIIKITGYEVITLHWLRVPDRISLKLAVLTYWSIHGTSVIYSRDVSPVSRTWRQDSRRRLQSSASHHLEVSPVRLSTVGKRAFPVAGANMWNDLPLHVTSSQSLAVFKQRPRLLSFLYPDILIWLGPTYYFFSGILCERCNNWHYLATLNMMMIWWWWWWCRTCSLKTKTLKFSGSGGGIVERRCARRSILAHW